MGRKIRIKVGRVVALAELNSTKTADAIWQALPIRGSANIWGGEVYFSVSVKMELEEGKELLDPGDLGYWPPANAFCIFFGPTPISRESEIRAASSVNVFGKIIGDPIVFKDVAQGEEIIVENAE